MSIEYKEPKTADELTDRIIYILDETPGEWERVGAFMETVSAALELPIAKSMWWKIIVQSHKDSPYYPYRAELYQGLEWNGQWHEAEERQAFSTCTTLPEAICRAWLEWRTS